MPKEFTDNRKIRPYIRDPEIRRRQLEAEPGLLRLKEGEAFCGGCMSWVKLQIGREFYRAKWDQHARTCVPLREMKAKLDLEKMREATSASGMQASGPETTPKATLPQQSGEACIGEGSSGEDETMVDASSFTTSDNCNPETLIYWPTSAHITGDPPHATNIPGSPWGFKPRGTYQRDAQRDFATLSTGGDENRRRHF
ncbi:hypothetical protein H0H92_009036 [Tricholoma furcatifolium]|nr:hypothetical protein H0H92_009036 [Tricholoma furcatifolium]